MEQIKHPRQSLSLKKILALYVLVSILVALFLSVATFSICNTTVESIRASYHISGEKYYLTNEQRERFVKVLILVMSKIHCINRMSMQSSLLKQFPYLQHLSIFHYALLLLCYFFIETI